MHIAFLNPQGNFDSHDTGWTQHPDFGGQLVYVKELALALGERGHRVDIITRRFEHPDWSSFSSSRDSYRGHENVRIMRVPCGPPGFLPKEELWPHLGEWIDKILAAYQEEGCFPVVCAGHYADGGLAAVQIRRRLGTPFTFTAHSLGAQKMDKIIGRREDFPAAVAKFRFHRRIAAERNSMAAAGRIITSTDQERTEQYAHRLYRGSADPHAGSRFAVIPPGVNLDVFGRERTNPEEARIVEHVDRMLRRDLPSERRELPAVICSSRLDRKKNHLGLLAAWAASDRLRRAANLLVVTRGIRNPLGSWRKDFDGEERSVFAQIVALMNRAGLHGCVSAFDLNSQDELAACYRYLGRERRGVFALCSLYEPFGLAPLEAMAAGLPAVVTRNGGPAESLRDGSGTYGILVDPEDPDDIARGVLELLRGESEWRRISRAGRQRVLERYTWARTAEGYERVFCEILRHGDAGKRMQETEGGLDVFRLETMYYNGGESE